VEHPRRTIAVAGSGDDGFDLALLLPPPNNTLTFVCPSRRVVNARAAGGR
jgi:hypothetical protein